MRIKNPSLPNAILRRVRFNRKLIGATNGLNRFFTTPEKFLFGNEFEPVFKRNGQTIYLGIEIIQLTESGGAGTGYDTVEFKKPPKKGDELTADYVAC